MRITTPPRCIASAPWAVPGWRIDPPPHLLGDAHADPAGGGEILNHGGYEPPCSVRPLQHVAVAGERAHDALRRQGRIGRVEVRLAVNAGCADLFGVGQLVLTEALDLRAHGPRRAVPRGDAAARVRLPHGLAQDDDFIRVQGGDGGADKAVQIDHFGT